MPFNSGSPFNYFAAGAATGAVMVGMVGAIGSVIHARRAMAQLEERMAEWNDPGLVHQPMRREFTLAMLAEAEQYLFTRLPSEIDTLRKINVDLHRISDGPVSVFMELKRRIMLAGAGLRDDQAAHAFAGIAEKETPEPTVFDPKGSPLHQPLEGLSRMKRQHEWLTKKHRGPVYGGCYDQASDQRELSESAMWVELREGRENLEGIAKSLSDENQTLVEKLNIAKTHFANLIALYEIAVLAYSDQAPDDAVTIFAGLHDTIAASPTGFRTALEQASKIAATVN